MDDEGVEVAGWALCAVEDTLQQAGEGCFAAA